MRRASRSDAPRAKPFTHWVVYDIPASARRVGPTLPEGASEGTNDFGREGWAGPKPPSGRHRYVFKLYALDTALSTRAALTKEDLEPAQPVDHHRRREVIEAIALARGCAMLRMCGPT